MFGIAPAARRVIGSAGATNLPRAKFWRQSHGTFRPHPSGQGAELAISLADWEPRYRHSRSNAQPVYTLHSGLRLIPDP